MRTASSLSLVRPPAEPASTRPGGGATGSPDRSELLLVVFLFVLNAIPLVGELVHPGRWSPGLVGFATVAAILTGRELWSQLRARAGART